MSPVSEARGSLAGSLPLGNAFFPSLLQQGYLLYADYNRVAICQHTGFRARIRSVYCDEVRGSFSL